jgi:L-threonylcarbamoyladenylate synthase
LVGAPSVSKVLKVDPVRPSLETIRYAAEVIRSGGLVAFPTETVYGLGADAYSEEAVKKIYLVKGRPADNPVIVHICEVSQLECVATKIPEDAYKLIKRMWPGPLTLILPKNPTLPSIVTSGLESVAVRMPAHPVASQLIRAAETPIAAPSANLSGKPSPTRGEHVVQDFRSKIEVILDAGETLYGVESTIINLLSDPPMLLRPGAYPLEEVENALGRRVVVPEFARGLGNATKALAPGMKHRHYAPDTPVVLVEASDYSATDKLVEAVREVILEYKRQRLKVALVSYVETSQFYKGLADRLLVMGSRGNFFEVARNLFSTLRMVDSLGVDVAVIEGVEEKGLGLAIMNRLRKAAAKKIVV